MNGGSLSMLKYEELINRAAQLILDHQENSQVRQQLLRPIKIDKQHSHPFGGKNIDWLMKFICLKTVKHENVHTPRSLEF